ncbi:hypothetical protein COO91_10438 (plasmid) [Nostoc flagelliforme CCNUN1]|uniref:Uncharacterized protein n=1 Tax=Nostoc flagelliforme CCNUN1 TaxID=2038116 RepID=A0A2K8TAV7_9NOSO|nr:hypothetical protein COO91_10438 [Nostoc flagelliforme CCNUN1]
MPSRINNIIFLAQPIYLGAFALKAKARLIAFYCIPSTIRGSREK